MLEYFISQPHGHRQSRLGLRDNRLCVLRAPRTEFEML